MAQMLVRDLSEHVVAAVKRRAKANGRSMEAEHRVILEAAVAEDVQAQWWERISRLRESLRGRIHGDSADLIRQDRDSR